MLFYTSLPVSWFCIAQSQTDSCHPCVFYFLCCTLTFFLRKLLTVFCPHLLTSSLVFMCVISFMIIRFCCNFFQMLHPADWKQPTCFKCKSFFKSWFKILSSLQMSCWDNQFSFMTEWFHHVFKMDFISKDSAYKDLNYKCLTEPEREMLEETRLWVDEGMQRRKGCDYKSKGWRRRWWDERWNERMEGWWRRWREEKILRDEDGGWRDARTLSAKQAE